VGLPEPRATLLIRSGPAGDPDRKHLFVLMTGAKGRGRQVLLVPITSRNEKSDTTCTISAGEHEFVQHDSVVEFRHARVEFADTLVAGIARGEFVERAKVSESLFARIHDGFARSRFAKPFARAFLRDYGA
jgi:hypothetical protein